MNTITVIGAGTMGNGIAHAFAARSFNVRLVNVRPEALEAARTTITRNLDRQIKKELIERGGENRYPQPHPDPH